MSRQPVGQRPLTLTEELERLEQSITLTLQEIDHNFSRAHRIVTSSILPIIEQYAEHSREVWEGSRFWKQFFEASANVSLSGYEEPQHGQQDDELGHGEHSRATVHTTPSNAEAYETPTARHVAEDSLNDIDASNLAISASHNTPRPQKDARRAESSSYEPVRRDMNSTKNQEHAGMRNSGDPRTPNKQSCSSILDDVAMTPEHSPDMKQHGLPNVVGSSMRTQEDPLLHTVLDKRYRIQATPLTSKSTARPKKCLKTHAGEVYESSPLAPPELHAEIFDSPVRRELTQQLNKQRTPGVSVLTPSRDKNLVLKPSGTDVWDDSDDDLIDEQTGLPFGASPPKTMQFHIPQSRLLKTPAKEASKQIVDSILASAGASRFANGEESSQDLDIDLDRDYDKDDYDESPSIVRVLEDDTF